MLKIIPAILTNELDELYYMIEQCEGATDRIQIDIIDGIFADNETIHPLAVADTDTQLLIDYHLMVKDPTRWVDYCIEGQADRIIGQIEMMDDQQMFVDTVANTGKKVGLAIDLATPVSAIDAEIIADLDVILVMSVKAGFGGQDFEKKALKKIEELAKIRADENVPFVICVDGGINSKNIHEVYDSGADEVCVGRRLFDGDIRENIGTLMSELKTQNPKL
jgi:ribulose-phosphate 3-epimerase